MAKSPTPSPSTFSDRRAAQAGHNPVQSLLMTTRSYLAIVGLVVGIVGLGVAINQPFASKTIQWAAFLTGIAGFILGMAIATTADSEPMS